MNQYPALTQLIMTLVLGAVSAALAAVGVPVATIAVAFVAIEAAASAVVHRRVTPVEPSERGW